MDLAPEKKPRAEGLEGNPVLYLFGFARAGRVPELNEPGVDGRQRLVTLECRAVTAICCPTTLRDFSGVESEARMQDIVWLEPRVCRHQEVISLVMGHSPVLPARFGTLFSCAGNLEKLMMRHQRLIVEFLDRVADKEEWAVKGLLNTGACRDRLLTATMAEHAGKLASLPPGRRYFYEQRLRAGIDREVQIRVERMTSQVAAHLLPVAAEFRERRLLPSSQKENAGDMVLNWAFLVPREAVGDFQARLRQAEEEQAGEGLILEYSGPWPPYSFSPPLN